MKVALIWPNGFDYIYVMPIALGYLKSNLDAQHHDVRILDCALNNIDAESEEFKNFIRTFEPDVIGISFWSPTFIESLRLIKTAKAINPKIVSVVGGAHPTSYPDRLMENPEIDFLFRGEAELSFSCFLEELPKENPDWNKVMGLVYRLSEGKLVKNDMQRADEMDTIKIPDYDAMNLDGYIKAGYRFNTRFKMNAPIWVTRGCPYKCGFCSAPFQNGRKIRAHSVEYMVEWVKKLYYEKGIRQFNIIDDNFTFEMDYAKEFCRAMIALGLKDLHFGTPNGIRIQRTDKELMVLMKQAGWENLVVAPESGSVKTLKRMRKGVDPGIFPPKVKEIREAGLKAHGFFIVGYPGETEEDIRDTVKLLRECRFNFFFLNNFQPLPGTPIYDELVEQGEIPDGLLPKNYSNGERVYTPETLKNFNFPRLVLREYLVLALKDPRNFFYMFTLISPHMILKKVGLNLLNMFVPGRERRVVVSNSIPAHVS